VQHQAALLIGEVPFLERARSSEPRGDEKFYFTPGDLGFPTFDTPCARRSCPEACGKSERVFRSRRSHFCVPRMVSGRLL
jgi:hypothetical protein